MNKILSFLLIDFFKNDLKDLLSVASTSLHDRLEFSKLYARQK